MSGRFYFLLLFIMDVIDIPLQATCPYRYYHCTGYSKCCPNGYSCSAGTKCYTYYYSSSGGGSNGGGALAGMIIGGIFGCVAFICICIAACSALKNKCNKVNPTSHEPTKITTTSGNQTYSRGEHGHTLPSVSA